MIEVSVVIPTRNRPLLLDRALQSVYMQEGRGTGAFECIVVDDGDPQRKDEIHAIVNKFGALYFPSCGDGGCGGGYSRNVGISHAKGTFIAFLDDDDEWKVNKLSEQILFMKSTGIPFTYTGIHIRDKKGGVRYSFRAPSRTDYYHAIMRRNFIGTTSTVIITRDVLLSIGGFDTNLPALQDYDLYIRILHEYPTGWLRDPLTIYHDTDSVDKISASRERFLSAIKLLTEKYRNDPCYSLLRKSFWEITLLKCVRSRRFLIDTVHSFIK